MSLESRIVLLSDGVTETEDETGAEFGTTQLKCGLSASDPIDAIFSAVHSFSNGSPAQDDRTLLVIDRIA
jgi:serine phosphatase RsbU (regulator of sigma subunit)